MCYLPEKIPQGFWRENPAVVLCDFCARNMFDSTT